LLQLLLLLLLLLLLCLLQSLLSRLLLLWLPLLWLLLLPREWLPPQQQVVGLHEQLRTAHAVLYTLPQRHTRINRASLWCLTGLCGPLLPENPQGPEEKSAQSLAHGFPPLGCLVEPHTQRLRLLPVYGVPQPAVALQHRVVQLLGLCVSPRFCARVWGLCELCKGHRCVGVEA
jgi:hypothetical protein